MRKYETINLGVPLKIHFGGQANLFDSGLRQGKSALASTKADFPSLPGIKNLLLAAQKQLLELPLSVIKHFKIIVKFMDHGHSELKRLPHVSHWSVSSFRSFTSISLGSVSVVSLGQVLGLPQPVCSQ